MLTSLPVCLSETSRKHRCVYHIIESALVKCTNRQEKKIAFDLEPIAQDNAVLDALCTNIDLVMS